MFEYYLFSAAPVLLLIGIAVLAGRGALKRRRKDRDAITAFGRTYGLTVTAAPSTNDFNIGIGPWEMKGTFNGVPIHVYGKSQSHDGRTRK